MPRALLGAVQAWQCSTLMLHAPRISGEKKRRPSIKWAHVRCAVLLPVAVMPCRLAVVLCRVSCRLLMPVLLCCRRRLVRALYSPTEEPALFSRADVRLAHVGFWRENANFPK
jgi:hypothetical protein